MSEIETFLSERIETTKAQIVAIEDAIIGLTTNAIQSYTLSTGQTTQTVTKSTISVLETALERLLNRLAVLDARVNRNAHVYMRPGF